MKEETMTDWQILSIVLSTLAIIITIVNAFLFNGRR